MNTNSIIEVGNLVPPNDKWQSRQYGRLYSPQGLAPTLCSNRLIREGIQILLTYD